MTLPLFHVDAFSDKPFSGNPAAVCLLNHPKTDSWLQAVAAEMNLSETAFLAEIPDGFQLRWFTPKVEVALCGHATLASACVLWAQGLVKKGQIIQFHTQSGVLNAAQREEEIELDFPLDPPELTEPPANFAKALGMLPKCIARGRFDYLAEVETEQAVRSVAPDFKLLAGMTQRGLIVTSRSSDSRFDFVSRFFAPAAGIDEDPVTGSSHCCLGAYWQKKLGKNELLAFQASARGGVVRVRVQGDRAFLCGKAVIVAKGDLLV